MAEEIYGAFEYAPKGYTRGTDIGKGQIGIPNINPPFFLEIRLIKSHTHTGVDSLPLQAEATPEMIRGFKPREREERGTVTWTGGSSVAASLAVTFLTPFNEVPTIYATATNNNGNINVGVGNKTITGCTIYWRDVTGAGNTSVPIDFVVKGR